MNDYTGGFDGLNEAIKSVTRAMQMLTTAIRRSMTDRQNKHADKYIRVERAYERQAAAIQAKMNAPKPTPAAMPIRLGEHVRLTDNLVRCEPRPSMGSGVEVDVRRAFAGTAGPARDRHGRGRARKIVRS